MILKIHPMLHSSDDWAWKHNKSEDYSVKSWYWLANQICNKDCLREAKMLPSVNPFKDQVWRLQTSPKIKSFLQRFISGAILVADKRLHQNVWRLTLDAKDVEMKVNLGIMCCLHALWQGIYVHYLISLLLILDLIRPQFVKTFNMFYH